MLVLIWLGNNYVNKKIKKKFFLIHKNFFFSNYCCQLFSHCYVNNLENNLEVVFYLAKNHLLDANHCGDILFLNLFFFRHCLACNSLAIFWDSSRSFDN